MRRSIFLRTLWSFRVAILGCGVGVGLLLFIVVAAFARASSRDLNSSCG